jgi:hypothetical protein
MIVMMIFLTNFNMILWARSMHKESLSMVFFFSNINIICKINLIKYEFFQEKSSGEWSEFSIYLDC